MKKHRIVILISILAIVSVMFSACSSPESASDNSLSSVDTIEKNTVVSSDVSDTATADNKPSAVAETEDSAPDPEEEQTQKNDEPDLPQCSLSVRCDSVLKKLHKLPDDKIKYIPKDGIMYENQSVSFNEGETVFDILCRELEKNKIPVDYTSNNMFNSIYIRGIGNLYEFDGGASSGWIYSVNGKSPTYGCAQYEVKNGDQIEFYYT